MTTGIAAEIVQGAPESGGPRETIRYIMLTIAIAGAAIVSYVFAIAKLESAIDSRVKPVREVTIENSIVLDSMIDYLREQCIETNGAKCTMKTGRDLRAAARLHVRTGEE